jgi:hypothetical protein
MIKEITFGDFILLMGTVVASLIIYAIILLIKKKNLKKETSTVCTSDKNEVDAKIAVIKKELLMLNICIREEIYSNKVKKEFEDIIDLTISILIPANDANKYAKESIIVNRMSSTYLPKILSNYLILSDEDKTKGEESILNLLSKIKEQLISVKKSYESENTEEFNRTIRILEKTFDGYSTEEKGV